MLILKNLTVGRLVVMGCITSGCKECNFFECVCDIKKNHQEKCKFRKAATCVVGIECEHGYEVCSTCDPCTCNKEIL